MKNKQAILAPLLTILLSLVVGAIVIIILGKNPLTAYQNLLQGSGILPKDNYAAYKSILTDFTSFLNVLTPMIFAALAVAVALRAGLFNIGISGQMLIAGFVTTVLIGYSGLGAILAKPLVLIVGAIVGALVGGFVGWLKYRFNINEVVSTIMINYIGQYIVSFFINIFYINPVTRQSNAVSRESRLTLVDVEALNLKMDIPLGIIVAVIAIVVVKIILDKTTFGYSLKCVGLSPSAARYAGIPTGRTIVSAMMVSGALAGLAGVTFYMGYFGSIQPMVLPSTGFDAIAVALLANNNPVGIFFSSFLITAISKGSTYMNSTSGLELEIAAVITGLILLFSACKDYIFGKILILIANNKKKAVDGKTEENSKKGAK